MIQSNFRRIYMESRENNGAYVSPLIFTNRLIYGKEAFFILFILNMATNHITSQMWIFVMSPFSSLLFCELL